ncbi:hypothetical protein CYMTET_4652 [Cymbomonas tetramitiformis]|uniref:Uncharacterized protein n=1 Tax=Cymbomonas tetramitiformis TaxID=36881 RepID=A0AAE0H2L6_9CHLO|nr:hypothetical protein CYMTET_4652 [Cymbomonas tetramitiformis]
MEQQSKAILQLNILIRKEDNNSTQQQQQQQNQGGKGESNKLIKTVNTLVKKEIKNQQNINAAIAPPTAPNTLQPKSPLPSPNYSRSTHPGPGPGPTGLGLLSLALGKLL